MLLHSTIYTVPSRSRYFNALVAALDEPVSRVIVDVNRDGLWPTARRAWTLDAPEVTHQLVMQDDITPAPDLIKTARLIASLHPDRIISLYSNRKAGLEAATERRRFFRFRDCTFGQALLMPSWRVRDWLTWEAAHIRPDYKWDDARLGAYCWDRNVDIYGTVPALVQHAAPGDSTVGNSNRTRVSPYFFGEFPWSMAKSPLLIDWSPGDAGPLTGRGASIYREAFRT